MELLFFISLIFGTNSFAKDRPYNFGIVINNPSYQIYRSSHLGKKGLKFLSKNNVTFPKTIIYMNWEGYSFPWYYAIDEYKASLERGFNFYHPYGLIRTYLDGHDPYNPTDRIDSRRKLGVFARRYFNPGNNEIVGGTEALMIILNLILDERNQPVLFHCMGGMHRTGMVAMLLRYIQGGPWTDDTVEIYKGRKLNQAQHEYRIYNPHFYRPENLDFVERFSQDARFVELVRKYRSKLL